MPTRWIEFDRELPESRFFYWPNSSYSRAWSMLLGCPWAGVRMVEAGKLTFVFSVFSGFFDYLHEHGLQEALKRTWEGDVPYLDLDGTGLRVVLIHGDRWASQCDLVAISQLLSGYWVVSSRKSSIDAVNVKFCCEMGNSGGYWFLRDLVRGVERVSCEICGKRHEKRPYGAVFQFWRLEGLKMISDPVEVFGGPDCQDLAREKQRDSYWIARKQLKQTKEQLKCLLKGKKQLREIRNLLRPPSNTASLPA